MQQPIHNPYAPPTVSRDQGTNESERYEFNAEVSESDVHRAVRSLVRFSVGFSFLSCGLLFSALMILVSLRPGDLPVLLYFALSSFFLLFLMIRTTWIHIGPGAGRLRVRTTPLIIGPIYGTVTNSEIRICNEKCTSIHPLKSCCYAQVRSDSLVLAFDQRRLLLTVIPRRAFASGCFERAAMLLIQNALASKVSPADGLVDQRLQSGDFYPIDLPTDGVAFSGSITSRDVLDSPLRSQTQKVKRILIAAIGFMTLLPLGLAILFYDNLRFEIGLVVFVFFLFLNLRLWRTYRKNVDWTKSPEQVLMRSRGVLNHQGLHASTPAGASIYRWGIFTEATFQDNLITLALPRKLGHRVFLPRSQFASDSDWSQAKEIIREQASHFPIVSPE